MTTMQGVAISLFVMLGGVGLLLKWGGEVLVSLIDKGGDWVLKFPKARAFIKENAPKLREILNACEDELEKDIDSAEKEQ